MAKLLVLPNNKNIEEIIDKVDGFLFGIKGYSVNVPCVLELEELKEINDIVNKHNKELFISLTTRSNRILDRKWNCWTTFWFNKWFLESKWKCIWW